MRAMLDASLGGHIEVQMKFGAGIWPIEVDPGEMELAIVNLCVNARDAMPDGGIITITVENVRAAEDRGDFVKISVADTGVGMSPDVQARVFEPFFTTKDVNKGSGLGLPQVYGFAQQSRGSVSIDSQIGMGTIVTLELPRSLGEPAAASRAPDIATPGEVANRGQILLVEDDKEVSALTRELLSELGFSVLHVASPDAALGALANARDIDVVLSDIMMPGGVSGVHLAREIRRRHPDLRVVLTTGYVEAAADLSDGEFDLLLKPYTAEALAIALRVNRAEASPARVFPAP
jgi:CheY-like chemotaxis protein